VVVVHDTVVFDMVFERPNNSDNNDDDAARAWATAVVDERDKRDSIIKMRFVDSRPCAMDAMKDERCDCNEWRRDASEQNEKKRTETANAAICRKQRTSKMTLIPTGSALFVSRRKCER
jgi:hypothetical protein